MKAVKVWLDDVRAAPDKTWVHVRPVTHDDAEGSMITPA
jgi:hypothetical protein